MGASKQTMTTSQQKDPWAPAQPALKTALDGAMSAYNNTYNGPSVAAMDPNVTAGQNAMLQNAENGTIGDLSNLSALNIGTILGNGGLAQGSQGAMDGINSSLGQFNAQLGQATNALTPYATGQMLGANPYLNSAIDNAMSEAANKVNAQFSAAGRYGSGAQSSALGKSLGDIATNARMNAYNQDQQNQLAAINSLGGLASSGLSGNVTGQGAIANIGQQGFSNTLNGLNSLGTLNTAQNLDAQTQANIGAQRMDYNQALIDSANNDPWTKVNNLTQVAGNIGALGGQATGTSTTTQDTGLGGILGGVLSGLGGLTNFGKAGGFSALFSDERLKEDVREVGELHDGQKVYAYSYKGDPERTQQIGLLAQDVEKRAPEAVAEHPSGYKMVEYGRATAKAAKKGGK